MATVLELGEIEVEVVKKDIKNIHLSVYPPIGRVRISAPRRMNIDTIRVFAISKLGWIRQRQKKLRGQQRESPREYIDRESHYVWGKRYLLRVSEADTPPALALNHSKMLVRVRPRASEATRKALVEKWYRGLLKSAVPDLIAKWELRLNVKVRCFSVQRMKTKWGSCNPISGNIRFNTELAKKAPNCLEYILVHEMLHLITCRHDERFMSLLNHHLPDWKLTRQLLNAEPLAHEDWLY